jgi:ubiquinone biosynthesis protein COQ4
MPHSVTPLPPYRRPDGVVPQRRSWRIILGRWRGFIQTGTRMHEVYEAYLELNTPANSRSFDQFRTHPYGRNIIRDKPDLLELLRDDGYLASLPVGSVGHAYRSFLACNLLDAGVFDEATVVRPLAEMRNWHEDFYYFMVRNIAVHDLLHVVTGYGPDMAGEIAGIGFQCGQMEPAGPFERLGYLMALSVPGASIRHKLRVYRQAVERGRRADKLWAAPWEQLLPKPVNEVREWLGVASFREAHPQGPWFTSWTPLGMAPPNKWDYGHNPTLDGAR